MSALSSATSTRPCNSTSSVEFRPGAASAFASASRSPSGSQRNASSTSGAAACEGSPASLVAQFLTDEATMRSGGRCCDPRRSVTVNVEPCPCVLSTATVPPWSLAISATSASPMPEPSCVRPRNAMEPCLIEARVRHQTRVAAVVVQQIEEGEGDVPGVARQGRCRDHASLVRRPCFRGDARSSLETSGPWPEGACPRVPRVRVIVDLDELRPPPRQHFSLLVEHQGDRGAKRLRPRFDRSQRGRRPINGSRKRPGLPAAAQERDIRGAGAVTRPFLRHPGQFGEDPAGDQAPSPARSAGPNEAAARLRIR
jgi:hypothetical protein